MGNRFVKFAKIAKAAGVWSRHGDSIKAVMGWAAVK